MIADNSFHCPQCGREVYRRDKAFPFCSDRCRLIDLGRWADGAYRIPGDPAVIPGDDED